MPYLLNNLRADAAYVEKLVIRKEQCWELEKNKNKRPENWKKSNNNKDDSDNKLKKTLPVIIVTNKSIYQGIALRKIKRRMA